MMFNKTVLALRYISYAPPAMVITKKWTDCAMSLQKAFHLFDCGLGLSSQFSWNLVEKVKEDPSAGSLKPVNRALTLMEERQLVLCVLIHFDPVSLTHSLADPLIYS